MIKGYLNVLFIEQDRGGFTPFSFNLLTITCHNLKIISPHYFKEFLVSFRDKHRAFIALMK